MSVFTTIAKYTGAFLKSGNIAIHERANEIYFGITDKTTVEILHSRKDSGWVEPLLLNDWETYDEVIAYRKDAAGILHIKGTARYGILNYAVFQLPKSYRPTRNISLITLMQNSFARVDINIDGYVIPRGSGDSCSYLSLELGVIL